MAIPLQSMANFLLQTGITSLKLLHDTADKKQQDKITVNLLLDKCDECSEIGEILLLDDTTVWRLVRNLHHWWYQNFFNNFPQVFGQIAWIGFHNC